MTFVNFSDGNKIPALGLGTFAEWQDTGITQAAVETAIDVGYRHFDCAFAYGNEDGIGRAIKKKIDDGVIKRKELFITSKLWNTHHRPGDVRPAIEKTLNSLGLPYIDLYLMHWPMSYEKNEEFFPKDCDGKIKFEYHSLEDTWKAMEDLVDAGLTKSIGLSNFNISQIERILKCSRIKPVNLQIEISPYFKQESIVKYCFENGITVTVYAPFGSPAMSWKNEGDPVVLNDHVLVDIAKKKGKSAAQVVVKFMLQRGLIVIPKSVTPKRIRENFEVQDFELNDEELGAILNLDRNLRFFKIEHSKDHPEYPFRDELA